MQPITKWEQRKRNDVRGQARYEKRPHIDKLRDEMRLARQLSEVWT